MTKERVIRGAAYAVLILPGVVFMAAKGSGSIKYYEVNKSASKLLYLSEFTNTNPQAGKDGTDFC